MEAMDADTLARWLNSIDNRLKDIETHTKQTQANTGIVAGAVVIGVLLILAVIFLSLFSV